MAPFSAGTETFGCRRRRFISSIGDRVTSARLGVSPPEQAVARVNRLVSPLTPGDPASATFPCKTRKPRLMEEGII